MAVIGHKQLLELAAVGEMITGVALIVFPKLVVYLLSGAEISSVGAEISRVAGIALIGLGLGFWPGPAMAGMLAYSVLATVCLACLGVTGEWAGPILWPVVAIHAALTILFARGWRKSGSREV